MSQLVIVHDGFSGARETVDLYCGESLASNLRRLWPRGISGPWRVYKDSAHADNEIAATSLPSTIVAPFQTYILVRGVAADPVSFFINLAISIALNAVATLLLNRREKSHYEDQNKQDSPNNSLAGQTNVLRAGGRVPELYGTVRAYPDLLCAPIEDWAGRTQNLEQFFVLGMGNYLISESRLGETALTGLTNAGIAVYPPGAVDDPTLPVRAVPIIRAVKTSPEVESISLMTEAAAVTPVGTTDFSASAQTMTVQSRLPVVTGDAIDVGATLDNDGIYVITSHPATSVTSPPYIYGLDRALINETGASPLLKFFTFKWGQPNTSGATFNNWETFRNVLGHYKTNYGFTQPFATSNGWLLEMNPAPIANARGYVANFVQVGFVAGPGGNWPMWELQLKDRAGIAMNFGVISNAITSIKAWQPAGSDSGGGSSGSGPITPAPSQWYRAPLDDIGDDGELWVDVAFPQGLVSYISNVRQPVTVQVKVEIRRPTSPTAQVTYTEPFTDSTTGPLRWTLKYTASRLLLDGLPAGSGMLVRLTRMTVITQDDATHQYISDCRWQRLACVRKLPSQFYPDCTVLKLALTNSQSATSLGENAFNCIVTRLLPTWTGSAWTPYGPTNKWADAFVARCKATDGGNKTDAQIDLAGIYALQAQLDTMDGDLQGRISQTLDQVQDIDTELAQLADLVRGTVYRVGKKIFVTRDQATPTRIALFNGRTKNPDGESVAMSLTNDGENDSVTVMWLDVANGYKRREYTFPETPTSFQLNPYRAPPLLANWAQAWRRANFEWNRIRYRREQIQVSVTEDGRICRPGDVVNITDDIANLAATAGEVLKVLSITHLTLDRDVAFTAGHTYSILLRDVLGQATDIIPVLAVAGISNQVVLSRPPVSGVTIKGRDESMGTMYAFYDDAAAIVRPWLLTSVSASGPYVELKGFAYSDLIYQNDTGTVPTVPPMRRGLPTDTETSNE